MAWRTDKATPEAIERALEHVRKTAPARPGCRATVLSFMYVTDAQGKAIPESELCAVIQFDNPNIGSEP